MASELQLDELYRELILDHYKNPHHREKLENPDVTAEGYNPLCGDEIEMELDFDGDRLTAIGVRGRGCSISQASASMMTDALKGKTKSEAEELFEKVHAMLTGQPGDPIDEEGLGKLAVFAGVCEFPARVKCASLAWHTMHTALRGDNQTVTTE